MTTCLGGLAMQASRPQWDEEVTSFLPREESTRAVNLASLRAEAAAAEEPAGPTIPVGETEESPNFSPFSSTRIEDAAAWPVSPPQSAGLSQDRRRSELVDVTRIENQPAGSAVAETFVSELEVTAAPSPPLGEARCKFSTEFGLGNLLGGGGGREGF